MEQWLNLFVTRFPSKPFAFPLTVFFFVFVVHVASFFCSLPCFRVLMHFLFHTCLLARTPTHTHTVGLCKMQDDVCALRWMPAHPRSFRWADVGRPNSCVIRCGMIRTPAKDKNTYLNANACPCVYGGPTG